MKITFLLFIKIIVVFSIIAICIGAFKAIQDKETFVSRLNSIENGRAYYIYKDEKDFYADLSKLVPTLIDEFKNIGKNFNDTTARGSYKVFRGTGFNIYKYELSQPFYNQQSPEIIATSIRVHDIIYKKQQSIIKEYWPPPQTRYDSRGLPYLYNPGIQKKYVKIDPPSPHQIYQDCLNYFIKEELSLFTEIQDFFTSSSIDGLKYYSCYQEWSTILNPNTSTYGNEFWAVQINTYQTKYKGFYVWDKIINDITFYFCILALGPTILFFIFFYRKNRNLITKLFASWCIVHLTILLLASTPMFGDALNTHTFITTDSFSDRIWPFNKYILTFEKESVFMGYDEKNGGMITRYTGRKIPVIRIFDGYDCTEFIVYLLLGGIIYYRVIKRNHKIKEK